MSHILHNSTYSTNMPCFCNSCIDSLNGYIYQLLQSLTYWWTIAIVLLLNKPQWSIHLLNFGDNVASWFSSHPDESLAFQCLSIGEYLWQRWIHICGSNANSQSLDKQFLVKNVNQILMIPVPMILSFCRVSCFIA